MAKFQKFPNETTRGLTVSSSSYETAMTLYESGGALLQFINNSSTALLYKIDLYLTDSTKAQAYPIKTATSLAASTYALDESVNLPFYKAVISIASTATASTNSYVYQIDSLKYL